MHDPDGSFEVYKLLESFADGYGGWKPMDVIGKPLAELPETLVHDLMAWRWLADIVRRQKAPKEDDLD
jgi:hypothetical protein